MNHPLPLGSKIRIHFHSMDQDDDENWRDVFPGDVGEVISADYYHSSIDPTYVDQGWTYGLVFLNGCWIFVDEADLEMGNLWEPA